MSKSFVVYSEEYKEKCFQAWFLAGRPSRPIQILKVIPEDENNRKPNKLVLSAWRKECGWDLRADELFTMAIEKSNVGLINQKAEMLERQAKLGVDLQSKGMEYLNTEGFDSASSAVNAIIKGAVMEKESRGFSEFIAKLSKMSDADIQSEILRLSSKSSNSDIIVDASEIEIDDKEEEIDMESNPDYELSEN